MRWDESSVDPEMLFRLRPPDEVLSAALDLAAEIGHKVPSPDVVQLLSILAGDQSVRRVLEIGGGVGAATICLARGAKRAAVVSLGAHEVGGAAMRQLLVRAGLSERVSLVTDEPLIGVEALEGQFDRVHLAVPIASVRRLVDRVLPKLTVGGLLTVEGLLPPEDRGDEAEVEGARTVAGYLVIHPQLEAQVLAVGDGLAVARKKSPLVTEMGGPY